jgi:DNA replication licensing factor MCM5
LSPFLHVLTFTSRPTFSLC